MAGHRPQQQRPDSMGGSEGGRSGWFVLSCHTLLLHWARHQASPLLRNALCCASCASPAARTPAAHTTTACAADSCLCPSAGPQPPPEVLHSRPPPAPRPPPCRPSKPGSHMPQVRCRQCLWCGPHVDVAVAITSAIGRLQYLGCIQLHRWARKRGLRLRIPIQIVNVGGQ